MSSKLIVPACGKLYPETKIYDGLKLVDINVFPHFELDDDNTVTVKDGKIGVEELLQISEQHEMICLPNESILRCSDDGMHIIGDDPKLIYDGGILSSSVVEDRIDDVMVKKLVYKK